MERKKNLYITGLIIAILITIVCGIYSQRGAIIKTILEKKIVLFEQKTGANLSIESLTMSGLSTLYLNNVTLQTPTGDTLLHVKSTQLQINLLKLLGGNKNISAALINDIQLNISKKGDLDNYSFLYGITKNRVSEVDNQSCYQNIQHKVDKLTKLYCYIIKNAPKDIIIKEMNIDIQTDSLHTKLYFPETKMDNRQFFTQMLMKNKQDISCATGGKQEYCILDGCLGKSPQEESCVKIYSLCDCPVVIPYIQKKFETTIAFDTLALKITTDDTEEDEVIALNGMIESSNLLLENEKISSQSVRCDSASINFHAKVSSNKMILDSSSIIRINQFILHPQISWERKNDSIHCVNIDLFNHRFEAQDLFQSIPEGLCSNLKGIVTEGELDYRFHFKIDTEQIDSLEFSSSMTPYHFNIRKFGATDFREVSHSFLYHAFDKDVEVASFIVGEENPNFVHSEEVSTYLRHAILYSEDGFFFSHKGFYEEAFRSSLVKDIKEKRFARGGSTISMQLVKNLWLSKEKTLSRKLEEATIVWLIENKRLLSKERMYEIYLNIIEWGPMIYGVKQAARFYFDKEPSELTIEEAIFMTSIIPKPKKFMWSFDSDQNLKPFLADYFHIIGQKLLKHEIITQDEFDHLKTNVKLKGDAVSFLKNSHTVENNETEEDYEEEAIRHLENLDNNHEDIPDSSNTAN